MMQQIKAIITDVDGVMVGGTEGVNFPLPHPEVIQALKRMATGGIPVVLCTAKLGHAVKDIALQAQLANPHITDGGALIIDWVDNKVIAQHTIDPTVVQQYVQSCLDKDIYVELYTATDYCIQRSQTDEFTTKRSKVLQMKPRIVPSILEIAKTEPVIKMISFSKGTEDIPRLEQNAQAFTDKISLIWSQHPFLAPRLPFIMTRRGVSKQHASLEVARHLGISPANILGIGDAESDWNFMQLCGYVATIGSNTGKLQELARTKGQGHYYLARSVDDHGLLEACKHFGLLD